jgi:hypothetical protein
LAFYLERFFKGLNRRIQRGTFSGHATLWRSFNETSNIRRAAALFGRGHLRPRGVDFDALGQRRG